MLKRQSSRTLTLDVGIYGQCTSVLMWEKILNKGLRGFIDDAKARIENFKKNHETAIDKLYFWESAIIVCEAAIKHANRYADLAADMAEKEADDERKAELLEISRICRQVPEFPAKSFREALQCMAIIGVCKNYENPMHNNPQW